MKRLVLLGIALTSAHAWGQTPNETSDGPLLCAPFVRYAENLLRVIESNEERGFIVGSFDESRRTAAATIGCAESGTRLLSQTQAAAELEVTQRQFEVGTNTSIAVGAAQVQVEKAKYCEAAFSFVTLMAHQYDRRNEVGLTGPADVTSILAEVGALIPVCGLSLN
jgi:hypothetical protein